MLYLFYIFGTIVFIYSCIYVFVDGLIYYNIIQIYRIIYIIWIRFAYSWTMKLWVYRLEMENNDTVIKNDECHLYTVDILYGPTKVCEVLKHRTTRVEHIKGTCWVPLFVVKYLKELILKKNSCRNHLVSNFFSYVFNFIH